MINKIKADSISSILNKKLAIEKILLLIFFHL